MAEVRASLFVRWRCPLLAGSGRDRALNDGLEGFRLSSHGSTMPHMDFLNFQGLLWMVQLELASLLDDYLRARHERRWLYARLLLLSLYESTKTLRSVFSRGLRKDIVGRLGPESETRVTNLHRYIHHAFEDLEADFGEIRNRLIGHKDPDPIARWRLMSAYSGLELKDFAWEVLEWCAEIAEVDNEYMSAIEILNEDARQRG